MVGEEREGACCAGPLTRAPIVLLSGCERMRREGLGWTRRDDAGSGGSPLRSSVGMRAHATSAPHEMHVQPPVSVQTRYEATDSNIGR